MGKFFKTLISSVKSFKSPSKQKVVEGQCVSFTQEDRNASRRKEDKDQTNVMVTSKTSLVFAKSKALKLTPCIYSLCDFYCCLCVSEEGI